MIMNWSKATKGSRSAPGSELTLEPITHLGGCWLGWAGLGWAGLGQDYVSLGTS